MKLIASIKQRASEVFASSNKDTKPKGSALFENTTAIETMASYFARMGDEDEILRKAGITRKDLRMLLADDEIAAAVNTRLDALIGTTWKLDSTSRAAKFVQTELSRVIQKVLTIALDGRWYGYSVAEIIYRDDGTQIGIQSVLEKPFEYFLPKADGSLWFVGGTNTVQQVELKDMRKFIYSTSRVTERQPMGEALFSRLYFAYSFRQAGFEFWVQWLERFGTPLLVGKGIDPDAVAQALASARRHASIGVGLDGDVKMLQDTSNGTQFVEFNRVISERIQKMILGQTLTTSVGASGSYAAAKIHNEVRGDKRKSDIRLVTPVVQKLVNDLWQLNNFAGEPPKFIMEDETGLEVERAGRDAILAEKLGVKFSTQYLQEQYALKAGDFTLDVAAPAPTATQTGLSYRFAASSDDTQSMVDALADEAVSGFVSPLSDTEIRRMIKESVNQEELLKKMGFALAQYNDSMTIKEQADILARTLFAADVIGYCKAAKR